ncbi:MAG: 50S ribosomal protein L21 [Myxococcales bacterium]|nr:50S ribosomal protein L21 [Myxococcales bacterium]
MYAVIRTGGKQYRVAEGDVIRIEKIAGESGSDVKFDEVLMVGGSDSPKIGKPIVSGANVTGKIVRQTKARRVIHFRKEKEGWTRMRGHRQSFTEIKITGVAA